MIPYRYAPEAEAELAEAIDYYEAARPGLGADFRKAVEDAVTTVRSLPQLAAIYPRSRCRQYLLRDYPYSVIYADRNDLIYVLAIAHHKRRPGYWTRRLRHS